MLALPGQPMVALAARLHERAQIRNAGNNLTLKVVVPQAPRPWGGDLRRRSADGSPDEGYPRGC
jgi:hypothetical protein